MRRIPATLGAGRAGHARRQLRLRHVVRRRADDARERPAGDARVLAAGARSRGARALLSGADRRAIAWMGILGFAGAYICSNWCIAHSTATNAALLITVEPISMILLSPWYLGERLSRREAIGATLTIVG